MPTSTKTVERTLIREVSRGCRTELHFDSAFTFNGVLGQTRGSHCDFLALLRCKLTPENGVIRVEVNGNRITILPIPGTIYKRDIQPKLKEALSATGNLYNPERAI